MLWLISQFPELEHLDRAQRAQLLGALPWWIYPQIVVRAVFGGLVFAGVTAGLLPRSFGLEAMLLLCALILGVVAIGLYLTQLRDLRRVMRREIALGFIGERPPFCFYCGYDLRGTTADTCPECGKPVQGQNAK